MAKPATSPRDMFTEDAARSALTAACQQVGYTDRPGELIRMGSNAVFRLGEIIARVAPATTSSANAVKQIAVARWLASIDYPAMRALDVAQPIKALGYIVTCWHSVASETRFAPLSDVAVLLRRLHSIASVPPELGLSQIEPFGPPGEPLPEFPGLHAADGQFLRDRIDWARQAFPTLPYVLPPGLIHGDANVGNVLLDEERHPVLADLDSFGLGPREWDLIQTALFYDRLGWHTEHEYQIFVECYGFDLLQWPGYQSLANIREVAMTAWLSSKAEMSRDAAREAAKRINAIRSNRSRLNWAPY